VRSRKARNPAAAGTARGLHRNAKAGELKRSEAESSYGKVQRQVLDLRRNGQLDYEHIADATRWMRKPTSYDSIEDALEETARTYRRNLWRDADTYVEIWIEKDALAGVIYPITRKFDVPLMVTRGFSSETFAYEAIDARDDDERKYVVYYFGDFDRSGRDGARSLREKLERFAADYPFQVVFKQIAVTEKQIELLKLPTRPHKRNSAADKLWPHAFACELDAIPPDMLRGMVQRLIEYHLPRRQFEVLMVAEESERELLQAFARKATKRRQP